MNLGIVGTSDIASKAILPFINDEIFALAVASRSYEKAKEFSKKYGIAKVYGNYETLLKDTEIDCVYIALPPALHYEWVCNALSYGKSVMVEKPMCLNEAQYYEIEKALENKNNFILECLMIQRHPWIRRVKEIVESKKYGKIRKCITNITMRIPFEMENGFRAKAELGGGVVYDEAPYWICLLQNIFDDDLTEICGEVLERKNNVVWAANIYGKMGCTDVMCYCSYNDNYSADFFLEMEDATLCVRNFFRASMGEYKITIQVQSRESEKITFPGQNYYRNQLLYFLDNINNLEIRDKEMQLAKKRACLLEKIKICMD